MHKKALKWWWVVVPILSFVVYRYLLDFNGLFGQDSHEYQRYAGELVDYYRGGEEPGRFFWPVNFPFIGSIISWCGLPLNLAMQGLAAGCLSVFLFCMVLLLQSLQFTGNHRNRAILFSCLILFSPFIFRSGLVVMSESATLAFLSMALYYYRKSLDQGGIQRASFLFIMSCALAGSTRYAAIVLLSPLVLYWLWYKRDSITAQNCILLMLTILISVAPNLLLKVDFSHGFFEHDLLARWSVNNYFSYSFVTDNGLVANTYPNIIYYGLGLFHPKLFCWLAPIFILAHKYWLQTNNIVLIATLIYLLFLFGIPEQNARYLIPLAPCLGLLSYPTFSHIAGRLGKKILRLLVIFAVLTGQIYLIGQTMRAHMSWNKMERDLSWGVNNFEVTTLYTFAIDQALETYQCKHSIINLYAEKIEEFEIGGLVLFNEEKFQIQWRGKNPMLNWTTLNLEYVLDEEQAFFDGWFLYRITQKK